MQKAAFSGTMSRMLIPAAGQSVLQKAGTTVKVTSSALNFCRGDGRCQEGVLTVLRCRPSVRQTCELISNASGDSTQH